MLKKNNLIKVLSLTSILFILLLFFNFTIIYAEKLPDVMDVINDVIEEILQDKNNKITKVKHLDNGKHIIVGYTENENDTVGSWIKIIDKGGINIKKNFPPEQDKNVIRKVLRCAIFEEGKYLLGGYQQKKDEGEKAWLLLLDQKGNIINKDDDIYGGSYYANEFKAITPREEGGYILVGWKCDSKDNYDKKDKDAWLTSLDSQFIEEKKGKISIDKKGKKDFATDIVSVPSPNSEKAEYIVAIKDEEEIFNSIRLIKINDELVKIGDEKEIHLPGKGEIYYITEDNEDGFILVGYDSDIKNNDNPKFLWVKKFLDIDREYEKWEYEVGGDNRFIFGVEKKDNENYFTLISYPNNIKIPLQLAGEGIKKKENTAEEIVVEDDIIEGKIDKGQSDVEEITTTEKEVTGEETEEGEEITIESRETDLFNKIKEYINNTKKLFLFLLIGFIFFLVVIYFVMKTQKREKVNKIEYKNFSLGRMEEIELLLKRIQIELKKELYEAEHLNNFSLKHKLKEMKVKFMSIAKKYKNKNADLIIIQNELEVLLKEIKVFTDSGKYK